jgi:hypothetical protein
MITTKFTEKAGATLNTIANSKVGPVRTASFFTLDEPCDLFVFVFSEEKLLFYLIYA